MTILNEEIGNLADTGAFDREAVAQTLTGAAHVISRYGLHKGEFWRGFSAKRKDNTFKPQSIAWDWPHRAPCCAIGAIKVAAGAYVDNVNRAQWAIRALATAVPDGFKCVADWNDFPETDSDEVQSAMQAVARRIREGEIDGTHI